MKKIALILSVTFSILTFVGAGYVLVNHGEVNAGYACVPMVLALASMSVYRKKSVRQEKTKIGIRMVKMFKGIWKNLISIATK